MSLPYCRVCKKDYKKQESRFNIYKKKPDAPSLYTRLQSIGITLENETISEKHFLSRSICYPCERKLHNVEKAEKIKHDWCVFKAKEVQPPPEFQAEIYLTNNSKNTDDQFDSKPHLTFELRCYHEMKRVLNSSMIETDEGSLLSFHDEEFCEEIDEFCPTLSLALRGALGALSSDSKEAKICRSTVYGALFKARYATSRPCRVASRNDQLLIAAGAKKCSFAWFNRLGLSNSYTTALAKNKEMSKGFNNKAKENEEKDTNIVKETGVKNTNNGSEYTNAENGTEVSNTEVDKVQDTNTIKETVVTNKKNGIEDKNPENETRVSNTEIDKGQTSTENETGVANKKIRIEKENAENETKVSKTKVAKGQSNEIKKTGVTNTKIRTKKDTNTGNETGVTYTKNGINDTNTENETKISNTKVVNGQASTIKKTGDLKKKIKTKDTNTEKENES